MVREFRRTCCRRYSSHSFAWTPRAITLPAVSDSGWRLLTGRSLCTVAGSGRRMRIRAWWFASNYVLEMRKGDRRNYFALLLWEDLQDPRGQNPLKFRM